MFMRLYLLNPALETSNGVGAATVEGQYRMGPDLGKRRTCGAEGHVAASGWPEMKKSAEVSRQMSTRTETTIPATYARGTGATRARMRVVALHHI